MPGYSGTRSRSAAGPVIGTMRATRNSAVRVATALRFPTRSNRPRPRSPTAAWRSFAAHSLSTMAPGFTLCASAPTHPSDSEIDRRDRRIRDGAIAGANGVREIGQRGNHVAGRSARPPVSPQTRTRRSESCCGFRPRSRPARPARARAGRDRRGGPTGGVCAPPQPYRARL